MKEYKMSWGSYKVFDGIVQHKGKSYKVTIQIPPSSWEDGYEVASPEWPECKGRGESVGVALKSMEECIDVWSKELEEKGAVKTCQFCRMEFLTEGAWMLHSHHTSIAGKWGCSGIDKHMNKVAEELGLFIEDSND